MENKNFKLNDFKSVTVGYHRGYVYYHFHDSHKNKRLTFNADELEKLVSKGNKLLDFGKKMKQSYKQIKRKNASSTDEEESSDEKAKKKIKTHQDLEEL